MKLKIFTIGIIFLSLVLSSVQGYAQNTLDSLTVEAICPSSVRTGESVTIGLQVTNAPWASATAVINKSALAALFPNGSILGPFTIPISLSINPGQIVNVPNYMTFKMPATSPANSVVGTTVSLCNNGFTDCGGGGCVIEVKP